MLYEVAIGKSFHSPRGIVVHENDLGQWIYEHGVDEPAGIGVYCYDDKDKEAMEIEPTHDWYNQRYCPWVPFDIDKDDNSDELTLHNTRSLIIQLEDLGLTEHNYKLWFSGKGYHVMVHGDCFGFPLEHKDLPYVVKSTVEKLATAKGFWDLLDEKVYMRTAIIRAPYSINHKTGLYKTPLTRSELFSLKPEEIFELAKQRRFDFPWLDEYSGEGELVKYVVTSVPPIRNYIKVTEPVHIYSCIYQMWDKGPVEGTRNNTVLVLASWLRQHSIPERFAKYLLDYWNNNSLDPKIILEKTEYVYNRSMNYSCKNRTRKKLCSTRCAQYSNQTKGAENATTLDEIVQIAKNRDFLKELKEGVNIGKMLGSPLDFTITRGEIIAWLGLTKAGKSTLLKNIALGFEPATLLVNPDYVRPTLVYTAEQASEFYLLSLCQILEGCTKEMAFANKDRLLDKWYDSYKHIMPIDKMPSQAGLKEAIDRYQPWQVIVDTMDHYASNEFNEHLGIKQAMVGFQEICQDTGVNIHVVNQVNRLDARSNNVFLFSAKGSGSVENQSRKVIGLQNTEIGSVKELKFLANTYGELDAESVKLQLLSSLRFKALR